MRIINQTKCSNIMGHGSYYGEAMHRKDRAKEGN
jgi:hypothetical protein